MKVTVKVENWVSKFRIGWSNPALQSSIGWFLRYAKALTLLLCLGLSLVLILLRTTVFNNGAQVSLDEAWVMGMAAQLQQGDLLGRDVFLTYGPLAQILVAMGMLLNAGPTAFDGYGIALFLLLLIGNLALAVILGLIRQIGWKYCLFIWLGAAMLSLTLAYNRSWLAALVAVGLAKALDARTNRNRLIGAGLVGLGCFLVQLFTVDLGIYTLGASCLTMVAYAGFARFPALLKKTDLIPAKTALLMLAALVASYIIGNVLFSLFCLLTSPNYSGLFDYQLRSWESVSGYTYTFGQEWALTWFPTVILGLVLVYTTVYVLRNVRRLPTAVGYLLLSLLITAGLQLKGAITRSDQAHILTASVPLLFLFLLIGYDWVGLSRTENPVASLKTVWAGLLLLLILSWPFATLEPLQKWPQIAEGKVSVLAKAKELHGQNTPPEAVAPSGLLAASDSTKGLLAFPYENQFPVGMQRRIIAPIVQSYAAHLEATQRWYIAQLERQKTGMEVLYGIDKLASLKVDNVQQPTRVPIIFEYLYRNFSLKTDQLFGPGFMLLQPTASPRQDIISRDLRYTMVETSGRTLTVQLSEPASCSLVRLTPKISYPITAVLGRATGLRLRFRLGETNVERTDMVAIEVGKPFSTYVQLTDPDKTPQIFGSGPVQQKSWDSLQFSTRSNTLFDVGYSSLEVVKLECVNFSR